MPSLINQTLLSQFRVDAFIASGGMGSVYRVWDLERNVPLAMKVLHAELAEDPSVFKRFKREANALKKLAHPNIVPFYGLYQTLDIAFLLERFVDGPSLKEILSQRKGQPLPIKEALIYLKALSAALGYAHANGVIHCDVKPANVMIDRGGNIYLTDFGIARHAESTTTTMGAAGTPAYMPPEQILGKEVTPATDVYSLGVMLFEMLTGQRPFRGTELGTDSGGQTANERVRYGQLHLEPPDPRSIDESIPEGVAQAILRALRKDAGRRFQSAATFLSVVCEAAGVKAEELPNQVVISHLTDQKDYSNGEQIIAPTASEKASLLPWLAGGGAVVAIVVGAIIFVVVGALVMVRGNPFVPSPSQTPFPTQTALPTYTPYPTTQPTYTPYPTQIPQPTNPPYSSGNSSSSSSQQSSAYALVNLNSYCRTGPDTSYGDVTFLNAGDQVRILGKARNKPWYLVQLNNTLSNGYDKCWIGKGVISVQGDSSSIQLIADPSSISLQP